MNPWIFSSSIVQMSFCSQVRIFFTIFFQLPELFEFESRFSASPSNTVQNQIIWDLKTREIRCYEVPCVSTVTLEYLDI
jgi:hypothetical protein